MSRDRVKAVAALIVLVSWLAAIFYTHSRHGLSAEHDFVTVIAGTHCLVHGCDPYDAPTLEQEFPRMDGYVAGEHFKPERAVSPPSTFVLLIPFSMLPWPVVSVVWLLLGFALLTAAFVVLCLHFEAYRDPLSFLPLLILLADGAIGWAVQLGQPVLIAAGSLTLAIVAFESIALPTTGSLLLAFSLCLQPQGAYLCGAYFLLRSRSRFPALAAYLFTAVASIAGALLFYLRLGSFAYLGHLAANVKLALRPGGDADSSGFLNLQACLARFFQDPYVCNVLTYVTCAALAGLLIFVCWRRKTLVTRPFTILAVLVMLQLLVSTHRLYDHALMLAAIPGLYEIKQRGWLLYLLFVLGLLVYHFSQFHGQGPFPLGAPVELFISGVCLYSLWTDSLGSAEPHSSQQKA